MVVTNNAHARVPRLYQYPQPVENTPTQRKRAKGSRVNVQNVRRVMAGLLIVAMAIIVVYRYGEISALNMELNSISNTHSALVDEGRHLEITMAQLTDLNRLEQVAVDELGLQYPHPDQVKFVGENQNRGDGDGE